jgi:catechol 2,3-dioxygenase-like lactoylglutathione lyase family enzyme
MAKRWLFTYMVCNDLQTMKWFYQEILHLELIWESDRSTAFKIEDHQISIEYHKDHYPFSSNYAIQPGWEGGNVSEWILSKLSNLPKTATFQASFPNLSGRGTGVSRYWIL